MKRNILLMTACGIWFVAFATLPAPKAVDYYPRIGFSHHPQAWLLDPGETLR